MLLTSLGLPTQRLTGRVDTAASLEYGVKQAGVFGWGLISGAGILVLKAFL